MNDYSTHLDGHEGRSRSGFINALLGALVMIVFSWIPFAPVVGGALAGYLEAGEQDPSRSASQRGLRVGALAGALAAIPALLVVAFVASILTVGWLGMGASGGMGPGATLGVPFVAWAVIAFVVIASLVYHVGLSAIGGWLGAELAERDDRRYDRGSQASASGRDDDPRRYADAVGVDDPDAAVDVDDDREREREDRTDSRR